MKNLFQRTSSHWVRYSEYEWKTAENGMLYLTPTATAQPGIYDPLSEYQRLILDAIDIGRMESQKKTQQEIQNLYERLDIVVVASREETVSMVAIEAMMMGKVCIVSNETGIAEYIVHEKNGFVFQNENENELASIMRWCYQNQQQLKIIGTNARKTYEENFSMHRFSMNIQNMLHK